MNYRPVNFVRSAEFAKANGTDPYSIGDVVGTSSALPIILLNAVAYPGGSGEINRVTLIKGGATVTSATFRVHFFAAASPAIADNSAWAFMYADRAKFIDSIDLPTMVSDGGSSDTARAHDLSTRINFQLATGATTLYAVITALAAYSPASAEPFRLEVSIGQK